MSVQIVAGDREGVATGPVEMFGDPLVGVLTVGGPTWALLGLRQSLEVLATQVALALERIALSEEVTRRNSDGPGITEVSMDTREGPIRISRADGRLATFSSPNRPDRPVALKRREVPALLAEELRRLDEDDVER